MIEKVKKIIINNELINNKCTVTVAFSGGADSTCLLYILNQIKKELGFELIAHHVNHNIRGKEALRDENFCKEFCKKYNIKLLKSNVDAVEYSNQNHLTLEEAARVLRYEALKNQNKDGVIALAHHLNDNVETIIHNLLRGSGLLGIQGMEYKKGKLIRPLLDFKREDIEKFLNNEKIDYITDSTNENINYTRNYIRKNIIPLFTNVNDKALEHIQATGKMIKDANDFIKSIAKEVLLKNASYSEENKLLKIDSKVINKQNKIIQVEIIKWIFAILNDAPNNLKDFTKMHIEDVIELSNKNKGSHLDLPYNITMDKKQGILTFKKNNKNISMQRRINK